MKTQDVIKSKFFWTVFLSAAGISTIITLIMGWNVHLFSTVLTISGFVVFALSFFTGWGHAKLTENGSYNASVIDSIRKDNAVMQGSVSYSEIFAAILLIVAGTLIYFIK
jgi:hypothetical protein